MLETNHSKLCVDYPIFAKCPKAKFFKVLSDILQSWKAKTRESELECLGSLREVVNARCSDCSAIPASDPSFLLQTKIEVIAAESGAATIPMMGIVPTPTNKCCAHPSEACDVTLTPQDERSHEGAAWFLCDSAAESCCSLQMLAPTGKLQVGHSENWFHTTADPDSLDLGEDDILVCRVE